jgi:hypothetical protein
MGRILLAHLIDEQDHVFRLAEGSASAGGQDQQKRQRNFHHN